MDKILRIDVGAEGGPKIREERLGEYEMCIRDRSLDGALRVYTAMFTGPFSLQPGPTGCLLYTSVMLLAVLS